MFAKKLRISAVNSQCGEKGITVVCNYFLHSVNGYQSTGPGSTGPGSIVSPATQHNTWDSTTSTSHTTGSR